MFGFGSLRTLGPDSAHSALIFARAACRLPKPASIGRLQGLEDSLKVGLLVNFKSKSPSLAQVIDTSGGLHGWTTLHFSGDGYSKDTAAACGSREVVAAQVDPPSFAQPVPLSDFLDFAFNKSLIILKNQNQMMNLDNFPMPRLMHISRLMREAGVQSFVGRLVVASFASVRGQGQMPGRQPAHFAPTRNWVGSSAFATEG